MFETPKTSAGASDEAELIERIYNVAISPHAYDDFMDSWEDYVGRAFEELAALKREAEALPTLEMGSLARHFEMGFKLLEELGRTPPDSKTKATSAGSAAAAMLIDAEGRVVWYNGAASRYFGLRRSSHVDELPLWGRSRKELARLIEELKSVNPVNSEPTILRVNSTAAERSLYMIAETVENGDSETLIHVSQVKSGWHELVSRMLSGSFGLSAAEVQIAEYLVSGIGASEIARARNSSVNTVRTQIKALLGKMGVSSQTELVRVLVSISGTAQPTTERNSHIRRGLNYRFRQRDERLVPYHQFGPENGRPFVFFHGMLDGCDLSEAAIEQLYQKNLTIYAPERPLFGSAADSKGDKRSAPERFARDVEDLLDYLKLDRVGLIGHMAGSLYAFAAAAHLQTRVDRIVNIAGGVPILSSEQFSCMSSRQRLVAYTARFTPNLLPFVLRAGIRQLDFGGEEAFMRALYEKAPADLDVIQNGEISGIIAAGYQFSVAQGHRAFEIDSYHVVRDWSAHAVASKVPVLLFHGRQDPVVGCDSVQSFATRLGSRCDLRIFETSGQLILYKHAEEIFSEIFSMTETI